MQHPRLRVLACAAGLAALAGAVTADARVTRLDVQTREAFAGGASWGATGAYERLRGVASMEVDPADPLNALIVDLDKAPRNARGMVEFSTPFFILKPVDMARGNRKIYYTVNNRANNPGGLISAQTVAQVGDYDAYLQMGYTIVDAGWEGDVVPTATKLPANLPIARNADGSSIVGPMRVEYADRANGTFTSTLKGNPAFRSYEAADTDPAHATFVVRDTAQGPRTLIPATRWAFGSCPTGAASLVPTTTDLCYFDGFRNDKVYELIYTAKNPIVMGLGFATTRDFASFLRNAAADDAGTPNPLGTGIRRLYATGASQTGGYLRDFMYLGFNEDEAHRKVFDGIIPTIAGTDRVFINVRFADPDVYSDQDVKHDYLQTSYPPFTYAVTTDPISGITDGVLKRPATDPLVFQIDDSSEIWQLRGSLNVVDGLGNPVAPPPNVRLYYNSSMAHGFITGGLRASAPGTNARCLNTTPTLAITETTRALLVAMDQWADQGIEPPRSNYPRIDNGTLVPLADFATYFPAIPGVAIPTAMNELQLLDFGPQFNRFGGVLTVLPPRIGPSYRQFVPRTDQNGNDTAGVKPIQISVPLGTTQGWNVRRADQRGPDLCTLTGSYIPFAATRAERLATGDPRLSLEERYGSHDGFVAAVSTMTGVLVKQRFLLPQDADRYIAAAAASDVLLTPAEACTRLNGATVASSAIGLPTTGAVVTATQLIPAATPGPLAIGEYCRVSGAIHPVDPAAPDIRFQLNLPTAWNTKTMMFGGGGYDGSIVTGVGNVPAGPFDQPVPLARGYATFGSDSGHQANAGGSQDATFAVNDEAINNFDGDALKKTFDTATALLTRRYGRAPTRSYFAGGSSGGREAFAVVQRWPQNFDGAISLYPAWNAASLDLQFGRLSRAFAAPGAYPNENKKKLLYDAVMTACDGLDNATDGVISNVAACHFDPLTLRCPGGADTGDSCLSDAQIAAYNAYNTEITFAYTLGSGETHYPGFNVYAGADTRGSLQLGTTPPQYSPGNPSVLTQPYWGAFWEQWVRFFVTRDPLYNALTFDPQNPGVWQARVSLLTQLQDVNRTDLSAFRARGGKLLIAHGTADGLVSTRASSEYYARLIATMGAGAVSSFARYYEIPGYGHASGTAFNAAWDSLTTLENWVERGVVPVSQVVADSLAATRGRTRPLCEYPGWPRYNGSGDVNLASSFSCVSF